MKFKILFLCISLCPGSLLFAQLKTLTALKQKIQATSQPVEKYALLSQLDGYYQQTGQLDSMEAIHKQLLGIAQTLHSDSLMAQTYQYIANYLSFKNDFETSLEFYFRSLHLAEEKHFTGIIVTCLNNIGGVYEDMENFGEAAKYNRRALNMLPQLKKKSILPIYLNWHMAYDSYNTRQPKVALRYLAIADKLNKTNTYPNVQDLYIQAHIFWVTALVAEQEGDLVKAQAYYKKAAAYSQTFKLKTPYCLTLNSYSKLLLSQGKTTEAKAAGISAIRVAQSADFPLEMIKASGTLSKIYTKLGRADSSNYYYQVKDSVQEKIFSKQRLSRLQDLTFTEQLRRQEEEAKKAELDAQRRNNLQYAGIAIALISFSVIFLVLSRRAARSPRLIEFLGVIGLLILFEFINLLLHPFIGKFTHESPSLMLLLMVFIAAILVPLHHKMESFIKHKLLKKER